MVIILYQKQHTKDGFNGSVIMILMRNEGRGRPPKKFEDDELQPLLAQDDTLSQKQMAAM